ncbi:hypothetical protein Pmar_PMAR010016 [Perkinsus marinus ATCC 50983]|uniref:Amidohydrolase-related domain-containing protein n=1 Tax=Perkinsus marinus (strain ATCC 50983 / TXsc) TaxID=423536 RepID=C5K5J3_PERM5|nr:hypothetical protein Pmar_PMAR010016 [Perkinsus marinus ATCC 50983]EER20255.1 hypothetical protein Pmar_PMAR010016 [Perkinsus marinus ATCC 50983]|eukprot:XP_002788459.1 hypothetical protein Pmar_PMAR010016 [Perkinsus marinus ATCC 50983]
MARKMVDAHGHPQMRKLTELISAGDLKRRCDTIGVKMVVACSTGPEDWEKTVRLDHSLYKPQVGIHPWYVTENMVDDLGDGYSEFPWRYS